MGSFPLSELSKSALGHLDGLTQWVFLLNGAAAAGLLTFIGNSLEKKALFPHWETFSNSLLCFSVGLVFAVLMRVCTAVSLNFLSQASEPTSSAESEEIRIYLLVSDRAVIFGIASLMAFVCSSTFFLAGVLWGRYAVFG